MSISYRLFETRGYQQDLNELAEAEGEWLRQKLTGQAYPQLQQEPHFGPQIKRLRGIRPTIWRYRLGRLRLLYHIDEGKKIVFLDTLEDRKEVYR